MKSPFPKCKICGHNHPFGAEHIRSGSETVTQPVCKTGPSEFDSHPDLHSMPPIVRTPIVEYQYVDPEISRVLSGRGVAASVTETVRGRISNREDEVSSRQPEMVKASDESSRPPLSLSKFDRLRYQREYMRDYRKAKPLGLTVMQWREKFGGSHQ